MKAIKLNRRFVTTLILLLTAFCACKKEKRANTSIIGAWTTSMNYDNSNVSEQTYKFNTDSTVRISKTIRDKATGVLLGYQYLSNGKFRLNGDQLKLYQLNSSYRNDADTTFSPSAQLLPLPSDTLQTYTIKISADGTFFHFQYPPCPINASCVPELIYKRQ